MADDEVEIALLTLTFMTSDPDKLLENLSKYVVLTRHEDGCRNVDLCGSISTPNKFVVIQKWESERHARAHFDSELMIEMANACRGLLSASPEIDVLQGISAHDLK